MSMTLTRSPLQSIGMNGAGVAKRRSARLSAEGLESDGEPPAKRTRITGAQHTTTVTTKEQDGVSNAVAKKRGRGEFTWAYTSQRRMEGSEQAMIVLEMVPECIGSVLLRLC